MGFQNQTIVDRSDIDLTEIDVAWDWLGIVRWMLDECRSELTDWEMETFSDWSRRERCFGLRLTKKQEGALRRTLVRLAKKGLNYAR